MIGSTQVSSLVILRPGSSPSDSLRSVSTDHRRGTGAETQARAAVVEHQVVHHPGQDEARRPQCLAAEERRQRLAVRLGLDILDVSGEAETTLVRVEEHHAGRLQVIDDISEAHVNIGRRQPRERCGGSLDAGGPKAGETVKSQ
jgi:hypothetical protein